MTATIQTKNYPHCLGEKGNWVSQQLKWNESKKKYDKKPLNSRTGRPAYWKNEEDWSTYDDAVAMYNASPLCVPAYIMTEADNLVCIDLDHCCDSDGNLLPYAEHLIDLFQSYTERSVSGDGIHIFVNGKIDLKGDVTVIVDGKEHEIEVFTSGKIIAMTGDIISDWADIEDGHTELEQLEAMVVKKPKMTVKIGQGNSTGSLTSDHELRKVENALQSVSSSSYSDWMKCGMAMRLYGAKNGCESEAWQVFDEWSKASESGNYDAQKNLEAWNSWSTTDTGGNQVTLGSVYHMAKENGWVFDNRSLTSSANGQSGGRPNSPPHADTAKEFYDATVIDEASGYPTTRYRDGLWHDYSPQGWSVVPKERIMSRIATYMQDEQGLRDHCSSNYFRSVRDNIGSYNMCATGHKMPTWLDTGDSANHWMAFSDSWAVNMLQWARVKAGLDEAIVESEYRRPVSPAFFSKSFVGYPLETDDKSMPMFQQYLDQVQPDRENQRMLQQMAGIALSDETNYETCHALIGSGANGKTVFLDILQHLIGRNNVSFIPLKMITERFQGFPLAENKLNVCNEMATDTGIGNLHMVEGMLKECISGGDIEVERKGVDKTFAPCRARFIFACNSMPTFVDRSDGIWRRLRVIDFPITVPEEDRDVHLADKIIASELPGVLQWALDGLIDVVKTGMVFESDRSKSMKEQHRMDCDKEKSFLHERCRLDHDLFVPKEVLYRSYKVWCKSCGHHYPMSKNKFLKRVEEIHPELETTQREWDEEHGSKVRGFCGMTLSSFIGVPEPWWKR